MDGRACTTMIALVLIMRAAWAAEETSNCSDGDAECLAALMDESARLKVHLIQKKVEQHRLPLAGKKALAVDMSALQAKRDITMENTTSVSTSDIECPLVVREYIKMYLDAVGVVFMHIPKCAGTTITYAIFNTLDHEHFAASTMKACSKAMGIETLPMFTVTRNPYEKLVSAYEHLAAHAGIEGGWIGLVSNLETQAQALLELSSGQHWDCTSLMNQVDCIFGKKGDVLVHDILTTASLEDDWVKLQAKYPKLPDLGVAQNVGEYDPWCSYYNEELAAQVAQFYAADFEFLNLTTDFKTYCPDGDALLQEVPASP